MSDAPSPPPPRVSEHPLTWRDITAPLVWPLILRAPAMAFSPPRLFLGFLGAFLITLWIEIHGALTEAPVAPVSIAPLLDNLVAAAGRLDPGALIGASAILAETLINAAIGSPWAATLAVAPGLLLAAIPGFAIARSASVEYATGRHTEAVDALIHACRAIRQIALATLGPLALVALLALAPLVAGLLLGTPVLDLAGALLYAPALMLGLLIIVILALHTIASPLIVASLAIEDTDGFDAIQRAYAYCIARPLRLALYASLALVIGTLLVGIITLLWSGGVALTDTLAGTTGGDAGRRVLRGDADLGATAPAARAIVGFWRALLALLVSGYVFSLVACAGTMIYLALRRVCDGQDTTEIWDPAA